MSYKYVYGTGDMFDSKADVIVNPVNLKGAMGAGLAKAFKERDYNMYEKYRANCKSGKFKPGMVELMPFENRRVLNLPTKDDWRDPSDLNLIDAGLKKFADNQDKLNIKSIAFPRLGAGYGKLNFERDVAPLMEKHLGNSNLDIEVYAQSPAEAKRLNAAFKERQAFSQALDTNNDENNAPKSKATKSDELTK